MSEKKGSRTIATCGDCMRTIWSATPGGLPAAAIEHARYDCAGKRKAAPVDAAPMPLPKSS